MEVKIIDECEMKISLVEEFAISRVNYEAFLKEYKELIDKYRI